MSSRLRRAGASGAATLVALLAAAPAMAAAPGAFDTAFGGSGVVALGAGSQVFGVAALAGDAVVVAGQSAGRVLVQKLGSSGQVLGTYVGPGGYARSVAVAPDGKILIAGSSGGAMLVERLTPGLAVDGSFAGGAVSAYGGQGAVANGVAVAPDGSVVAAGTAGGVTAVAKFSSSGALQWTQGGFGGSAQLNSVTVQPDGKVVVVGTQFTGRFTNGLFARLTPGGSLDTGFVGHGASLFFYPNSGYTSLTGVAVQNNGQIVASGVAETPVAFVIRLNTDGSSDQSFGSAGTASLPSGVNVNVPDYPIGAYGIGVAGGGRLIDAGSFEDTGTEVDQGLWAFTATGTAESAFLGGNGSQSGGTGTVLGPSGAVEGCGVAIDAAGDIVTVGNTVSALPDTNPCSVGSTGGGFVSRFIGFGPPPVPVVTGSAPVVGTGGASAISANSARISGTVTPHGLSTSYLFQYGTTTAYGSSTALLSAGSGNAALLETAQLSGLRSHTTYHYRIVAGNSRGTTVGVDASFTTHQISRPPPLRVSLPKLPPSLSGSALGRHGVALTVGCSASCSVSGTLALGAALARRLHLGRHPITIAGGTLHLRRRGRSSLRLRLTAGKGRLLRSIGTNGLSLTIVVRPAGSGGRSTRSSRTVTLKP